MKLLLVDDEKHVRDAMKLLIDRDRLGVETVLEASDGRMAIELIRLEKPAVIVTDMLMPAASGAQLLEWLHANAPECKTVVVSGHDDFSLVRHTVQYGGTDYILKPIDPEQLNEALAKAAAAWRREEEVRRRDRQRSMEMNELKPVYWDKQLSALLQDPGQFGAACRRLESEFGMPAGAAEGQIVSIRLDTMDKRLKDKFGDSQDLLVFSLVNVCNEYLSRAKLGVAFRFWGGNEIALLLWQQLDRTPQLLEDINNGMARTFRCRLHFGVGGVKHLPAGLGDSLQEAREALRQRNMLQKNDWIHFAPAQQPARHPLSLADFEESLRVAVKSGSADQIQAALQPWFDAVRRLDRITLEQIDHWWNEYAVLNTRWLQQFFPNPDDVPPELHAAADPQRLVVALDEDGQFSIARWQQEFTGRFMRFASLLAGSRHKEKSSMRDIAKYIETHYREELSLHDIAARFFLSREYISRKFKQEFGVNLSDFLTEIRMRKAKLLLQNPNLRISEVAADVGFSDDKYFSKVFKKATGLSPAEYRKQRDV
ncbi:histidine kinase [Gordoniibacillus kamchatkensis]|uniref:Histidine kinase n=1 Tax=Gordoniibacillus kamchatkensis TaxID=1590651 RepID=A0ABR5ANC8_9BACL|nr:helix-turn-helix domain-containing protein [Paenibacillus sp. VKM B-2647]KIL41862.1 histidine kinase [Paenibacillus sp. VKM B-2647]